MEEVEGKDREEQVEVEREKRVKEGAPRTARRRPRQDPEPEPTRREATSSVKECALRARSTHGVHRAIVEVNIVIGVVLGEVLVARVVPLVVDAVIGLTFGLIAHFVIVVFVVAILHRIFLYGRYTLHTFHLLLNLISLSKEPVVSQIRFSLKI